MAPFHNHLMHLVVAVVLGIVIGAANPAAGQDSFSYYSDYSVNSDGSVVYGTIAGSDDSTCTHASYSSDIWMTGPNGGFNGSGWRYGFIGDISLPFDGEGQYELRGVAEVTYCSCLGDSHSAGGDILNWHLGFRTTYYTNPAQSEIACWYGSTACSSGIPTCTSGIGFSLTGSSCSAYAKATWLVGVRGATTTCLVAVSIPASGPGHCT